MRVITPMGSRESGRDRRIDRHRQPVELETMYLLQEIDEYVNFVIKYYRNNQQIFYF